MQSTLAHRLIMTGLISLLLVGLWLNIVPPLVRAATAPGQRVHSLARLSQIMRDSTYDLGDLRAATIAELIGDDLPSRITEEPSCDDLD